MEKKYIFNNETNETDKLHEPAIAYIKGKEENIQYLPPSIEQLKASVRKGVQQLKDGKFYTHEEVKQLRKL